jgi:DNA invertase Pin-like site-specific DNA recombinase
MSAKQTEGKITALYERLSRDDEQAGDSNSIVNQKQQLADYAAQHGFSNCVHYTDDGYSGGNFARPGWNRLMEDVTAGNVSTVLVKDMSRIGRDYLQVGYLTEVVFRQHHVRFIAIGNGVDSDDPSTSEFAPFMNIMNEWYLRDLSRKQRAAIKVRGESGKPTTNGIIYGYRKDPADKHHWLVDEEAAAVVRRIFRLTIEGHGPYEIARILCEDQVEAPAVYGAHHGFGTWKSKTEFPRPYNWDGHAVRQILSKPEYLGHTVNFRSHNESYKDRRKVFHAPEDWLIFENTHEAIIDQGTWDLAQKLVKTPRRVDTMGAANPLTGLVYCADCGAKMYNHRSRGGSPKKPYATDFYDCSTYTLGKQKHDKTCCCGHYITSKVLKALVLETIQAASVYAVSNERAFAEKVREASTAQKAETARSLQRSVKKQRKRYDELDGIIQKLYETFATGRITVERFDRLLASYEQEQQTLAQSIDAAEAELAELVRRSENIERFLELAKRYTDFSELTAPMLNEFIERIEVHAPDKSSGERVQEVDIYLKFIGRFALPAETLTEEEQQEAARLQKERARSREKYKRKKATQAQLTAAPTEEPAAS